MSPLLPSYTSHCPAVSLAVLDDHPSFVPHLFIFLYRYFSAMSFLYLRRRLAGYSFSPPFVCLFVYLWTEYLTIKGRFSRNLGNMTTDNIVDHRILIKIRNDLGHILQIVDIVSLLVGCKCSHHATVWHLQWARCFNFSFLSCDPMLARYTLWPCVQFVCLSVCMFVRLHKPVLYQHRVDQYSKKNRCISEMVQDRDITI